MEAMQSCKYTTSRGLRKNFKHRTSALADKCEYVIDIVGPPGLESGTNGL